MTVYDVNEQIARTVLNVVDKGLICGMGTRDPGHMCVEAAVCYAYGLPHGDDPPCVGAAVRAFKITLNDAEWSSRKARAAGMRRVAIAQLGSNLIDQHAFVDEVLLQIIKQMLPSALRAVDLQRAFNEEVAQKLNRAAQLCEELTTFSQVANVLSTEVLPLWRGSPYVKTHQNVTDSAMMIDDAVGSAYYASETFGVGSSHNRAQWIAKAARNIASVHRFEHSSYRAADEAADDALTQAAEIAVQALQKLNSKGCEFLHLCDSPT